MRRVHITTDLKKIYDKLHAGLGPQHWWPGETPFEVMVGAILTQNTNWGNVEKAIVNLKKSGLLKPERLFKLPHNRLARLIKPAGYYNVKARRLKNFLRFLIGTYGGDIRKMAGRNTDVLRGELLAVNGIGRETADSILLYALNKPVFVVDAYTKRILARHKISAADADYDLVQQIFTRNLKKDVKLFNEYHALIVRVGKEFCRKIKPRCRICPLQKQR
ncbi:MAG: endonuclease III domain-containing protein [Candidatus Omnitrophota bacterium]|nr:endonuclease III domain-containing protein [Candidatus Omnitrophota bacterium]